MGEARIAATQPNNAVVDSIPRTVVAVELVAANTRRRGVTVVNESNGTLYVKLGAAASSADFSVKMPPHAHWELPFPAYTDQITGIWDSAGGGAAKVTETERI